MAETLFNVETLLMLLPLFIIQLGIVIFCIVKILKEGVNNLSKGAWLAIVIFGSFFGGAAFLIVGRRRDNY